MASDTLIHFDNLIRVLNEYRQAVIDLYRNKLQEDDHVALTSSTTATVKSRLT